MNKIITQEKEIGNIASSLNFFLKFNIPKSKKILDIGCSYGSLIYNLYGKGYKNVQGIDVNKSSVINGKKYYKKINSKIKHYNGNQIPFKNKTIDVVLMFDVIEHIPNVEKFIRNEVKRVLKKNGLFIFQTPNKYLNIPWEIINKKSLTKWKSYHCSLQTKSSLEKMLRKSKFRNVKIEKYNILTEHNKQKVRRHLPFLGIPLLYILSVFPTGINPNLWGSGKK